MELLFNLGLAKISEILSILLSVIYILRLLNKKVFNNQNKTLKNINKSLRKYHKLMGITLILTGLIHGVFSSDAVLSINIGTFAWIASVLLGLNFIMRKKVSISKSWMYYHRILTIIFLILMLMHVVDVKINNEVTTNNKYNEIKLSMEDKIEQNNISSRG